MGLVNMPSGLNGLSPRSLRFVAKPQAQICQDRHCVRTAFRQTLVSNVNKGTEMLECICIQLTKVVEPFRQDADHSKGCDRVGAFFNMHLPFSSFGGSIPNVAEAGEATSLSGGRPA